MKADLHLSDYKKQWLFKDVNLLFVPLRLMEILSTLKTNMTAMGTNMAADMSIVQEQIGTVEDTLLNMNSRIGVLATSSTEIITAIDSLSRAPLVSPTNTMANVSQPAFNAPSEFSKKASNDVYTHIRNLMCTAKKCPIPIRDRMFSNNRPWIVGIWSGHLIQTFDIGSLFCILGFGFLILGTAILL
ncbi:hypothetical protein PHYBLDRAFT_63546 [Phycomyces blakesleeanus NRRL 1555(-)]|uniref:Uncharacterized protein n=1 Tax=Phycomyces blakesleeanus (strain ATCC 8743b / DSM 1359 / FGSC 10004 / NBRC 33097 / NRRL 1555) TaxID=763407 RepID=A0A162ZR43_PHYB8|nr:hypothetical protein PHYBLDRAFT_63546 [Phycomyces blakesleeanus NRRL 1555(-)]OAD68541.1 hypothetical protein PHYBLDRAFT_63546 [Phycomyces blakesleeanus NRRL 1555(-)]|eukprot:XP_018286581.1 hypothetical protein PHYBLDRAFT_63546 [Phycomyces blakesleeanus NRRL 1555(-)]